MAAVARVVQVRVLAVRVGLVAVVQPRDPTEGIGLAQQGTHQAVGEAMHPAKVNSGA